MKGLLILCFIIGYCFNSSSQIKLDNSQTVGFYIKNVLLGKGIVVGNIKHTGMVGGFGQFETDSSIIGLKSGLVLSTGNINGIRGPNNSRNYTSYGTYPKSKQEIKLVKKGDRDLNKIARRRTKEITIIEFDFVPVKNKIEFNYVFASEEYTEYVESPYNDVFAFFLSGPGIRKKINLAVLPDGKTPISINTINHKKNKKYFRRNTGFFKRIGHKVGTWYVNNFVTKQKKIDKFNSKLMRQIQFDGLTKVLKVEYDIIPFHKYHIKIAIADVSDITYDSAVFLEAGSFVSVIDTVGEYYDTLLALQNKQMDFDSILYGKEPVIEEEISEVVIEEEFEFTDIRFDFDSSEIPDSSLLQLDKLANYLNDKILITCSFSGFTDNTGTRKYNQNLSEDRAYNVSEYLYSKGITESRLQHQGYNFKNPKFDNSTEKGRARNRRVEILLF